MSALSLKNLSGKWSMSKDLSSDVTPVLEIQGFNKLLRSAVSHAPVNLSITQTGDELHIDQSTTASIPAVKERWDFKWQDREDDDSFLGKVSSKSRWTTPGKLEGSDGFLVQGLKDDEEVVEAEVHSADGKWTARQVWLIEDGHFVRRVVTTGGDKRAETKLVYVREA